ncbi:hypothetical protein DYI24_00835 [Rhodopseudomonas sp. BR0C11]|uniref:hypothetical protein n=1 Tax=Rhodopseudomonas sp. BR0C11 TaxID=2269370 RepID=UPI0013E0DA9E|nr:hypothetical protein [Rhodopseudomonas sp. BR0C11]NEV75623.1 hypothetical protein [Rhodopseudomonas sp. BR0C11]
METDELDRIYSTIAGHQAADSYFERHGIAAAPILTVTDDETADAIAEYLRPRIEGKTVVEIGGGLGLLSLHMGLIAKRVFCIEANPIWSVLFTEVLFRTKPRNVSYLFGTADEFVGSIRGDVAVICTHSDVTGMSLVAAQFAPAVIDVYGEIIRSAAPGRFDPSIVAGRDAKWG